jgi:hypothetical protein
LAQARAVCCLLIRQSKEKKERQKQQTKIKRIMLRILAMGSDFRCSVGTALSQLDFGAHSLNFELGFIKFGQRESCMQIG